MKNAWNPWHGCVKYSAGCDNCYMYFLDSQRGLDGSKVYKVKGNFDLPIQRDRFGCYKIEAGEEVLTNMASDFFLEEADQWRADAWSIIDERRDLRFSILTKRIDNVRDRLPKDWKNGWENVRLNVTTENQELADKRIPVLLDLPFKHKGIMVAPMIGEITLDKYLATGQIELVMCGGENYGGCRPCHYEWVERLSKECEKHNVQFTFFETGTRFVKDGKEYTIRDKKTQSQQAYKSGLGHAGKDVEWKLFDNWGLPVKKEEWNTPKFTSVYCATCGNRQVCAGCNNCGKCKQIE